MTISSLQKLSRNTRSALTNIEVVTSDIPIVIYLFIITPKQHKTHNRT